jgi:hypothetical protein
MSESSHLTPPILTVPNDSLQISHRKAIANDVIDDVVKEKHGQR